MFQTMVKLKEQENMQKVVEKRLIEELRREKKLFTDREVDKVTRQATEAKLSEIDKKVQMALLKKQ